MDQLKCKLAEYAVLYSTKIMWGMDCDLEQLYAEILKLQSYINVKESLLTVNECDDIIPTALIQKIDSYIALLSRGKNKTCRNCCTDC